MPNSYPNPNWDPDSEPTPNNPSQPSTVPYTDPEPVAPIIIPTDDPWRTDPYPA